MEQLLNHVCAVLNSSEALDVQPQSVSNVVWSLATLRLVHRPLLQVIALVCVSNMAHFKSFELSTTLWALAKLSTLEDAPPVDKSVFYAAANQIHNNVHSFGFRCLATTAWAFATSKQRHVRLFRSMVTAMVPCARGANCQEIANAVWAFGTLDFYDEALLHELATESMHRLEEFKPQEISNMLWGFATNGFFHEAFFANAARVAQSMELGSQHLANILWAFARVRPKHALTQQTVLALLPVCTLQLHSFKPQEVSSTLLAAAKALGSDTPGAAVHFPQEVLDFFHACMPWVVARLRDFSEQSLANTVSAFSMVPVHGASTILDCAAAEVMHRMQEMEVNTRVHLLKGFAMVPPGTCNVVIQQLAQSIAGSVEHVRAQELQSLMRLLTQGSNTFMSLEEVRSHLLELAAGQGVSGLLGGMPVPALPLAAYVGKELPEAPRLPSTVPANPRQQRQDHTSQAQARKPQAKARNRGGWPQEDFQQRASLCTISESGMMAAASAASESRPVLQGESSNAFDAHVVEPGPLPLGLIVPQSAPCSAPALKHVPSQSSQGAPEPPAPLIVPPLPAALAGSSYDPMVVMPPASMVSASSVGAVADEIPPVDPTLGSPYLMYQRNRRNQMPDQRRMFVKNSFLHVEESDDEQDEPNCDGNSSHRSSSMPSSMGRYDEERPFRQMPSADMLQLLHSLRNRDVAMQSAESGPVLTEMRPS
eukprot:TRINITY_DN20849_c0_g1_i2.p1 TRINITY_DN20849_c0_g1~~TRINITY_DN20849_c0_g1_i2.p1  ORF type:complete len:812 (-),score=177.65 TRINITY_DN20849_c0_g1_i2:55-2181(-)